MGGAPLNWRAGGQTAEQCGEHTASGLEDPALGLLQRLSGSCEQPSFLSPSFSSYRG